MRIYTYTTADDFIMRSISYLRQTHENVFFFFLMIRRPPKSTLFPTRRSSDQLREARHVAAQEDDSAFVPVDDRPARSEEHTSELQSQSNIVCRLLLEKKK